MAIFSRIGADISDEAIACTESVTINATTYYRGRAKELAANSVLGDTSPTYGAWTAASKGGSRLTVVQSPGVPADSTEVAWDLQSGEVFSTTSRTVYVYYRGHGAIPQTAPSPAGLSVPFSFPGAIDAVTAEGDQRQFVFPGTAASVWRIHGAQVVHTARAASTVPTGGDVVIRFASDGPDTGSPTTVFDLTLPGQARVSTLDLPGSDLTFNGGDTLHAYIDNAGDGEVVDVEVMLYLEVVTP